MRSAPSTAARAVALTLVALTGTSAQPSPKLPAVGPTTRWVHESWSVDDGLPVNSINQLLQSRSGYIWAATFDGLVRFDGVRFTVFNSATSTGLPSNRILTVREARDGALWLFTEQRHVVRYRGGRFDYFGKDRGLAEGEVQSILEDATGTMWVATIHGIGAIRNDRFVPVARDSIATAVGAMVARRDGSLWVATARGGVFRIDSADRARRVAADSTFGGEYIARLYEDERRTLWVATDSALWRWRDRQMRVSGIGPDPGQRLQVFGFASAPNAGPLYVDTQQGLYRVDSAGAVRTDSVLNYGEGTRLWIDGPSVWHTSGANVIRDGRQEFALAPSSTAIPGGVEPYTITTALLDREGSLWLGTRAAGLHRLKPATFTTVSAEEGVADRNVYPTYVDSRGTVWVGTQGQGLSRIDPSTHRAESFGAPRVMTTIFTLLEAAPGELWVGGRRFVQSCTMSTMTCRAVGPSGLEQRGVFSLHRSIDGAIWVGARVGVFRVHDGTWTKLDAPAGLTREPVRAFVTTRDSAVWMGTSGGGILRYRDGGFSSITTRDGLPSDLVRSLYEDGDGWLWVGTEGRGLARLDPRAWGGARAACTERSECDRRIRQVSARDGLFDDVIHQILEDGAGRLWMSTNRGIFWVTRAELDAFLDGRVKRVHSTGYTERDGLRNREANGGTQPAGAKGPDGRLWFPTQDGVAVVDPRAVGAGQMAAPTVVEQIVANGTAHQPNDSVVRLGAKERDVQIEYTALTFLEPKNVRFRYRLDPYDGDWVDAGNRRTAFYTKVPPSRYTFRVQASASDGKWQEPGAALAIDVVPHFWETPLFRWAAVATLGTLVLLGFRWRINALHERAAELERVVGERTAELRGRERQLAEQNVQLAALDKAKTRFFANVSHELRTPLSLTIGPLQDLRARVGADAQANRWVDLAMRNSQRLLRLVNQILDVAKLEAGAMTLAPRALDLVTFVRGIASAFMPVAEQRSIVLEVEAPNALPVSLDPDVIEKIVTNLLSNAIKFTPPGGSVDVTLVGDTDTVTLTVRDTGPGIPPDQLQHVFERFYQADESNTRTQPGTGIGLSLVKELVDVQGGRVSVTSDASGTTFSVTVPRGHDVGSRDGSVAIAGEGIPETADHASAEAVASLGDPPEADDRRDDVPTLLVVDDSADLRAYIGDHFAGRFRVIEGADGADGIMLAQQHLPDVIVSDVMMPGTDGHALLRALRASPETDFVPVILLTAQADGDQRIAGLERGADDYIVKPFEMRELDARVRNIIESRRRLRARFAAGAAQRAAHPVAAPAPSEPERSAADQAFMDKVRAAIERHMADPEFGVAELAREAATERSHLFRRTRDLFGEAPSDVIRRTRLAAAARLLDERSGTVADVAYAVGFNSVAYFRRCFQDVYGVTPAAYRDRPAA